LVDGGGCAGQEEIEAAHGNADLCAGEVPAADRQQSGKNEGVSDDHEDSCADFGAASWQTGNVSTSAHESPCRGDREAFGTAVGVRGIGADGNIAAFEQCLAGDEHILSFKGRGAKGNMRHKNGESGNAQKEQSGGIEVLVESRAASEAFVEDEPHEQQESESHKAEGAPAVEG
jgi:hypothetical protein